MEAGRGHPICFSGGKSLRLQGKWTAEEGEEVGRLTGLSTATVSGFLLGSPPTGTSGNMGLKVSGAAGGRGGAPLH